MPRCGGTPGNSANVCQSLLEQGRGSDWGTYTAEEMAYKYDQNPAWSILIIGIQALEGMLSPVLIQHRQVCNILQVAFGRRIVVNLDVPLKVGGRVFDSHIIERGARIFSNSVKPEDEGYEDEGEQYSDNGRVGE